MTLLQKMWVFLNHIQDIEEATGKTATEITTADEEAFGKMFNNMQNSLANTIQKGNK